MRFEVLGPVQVHGQDAAIGIRPGHTHLVLCVLLSRANQYVSVADLVDAQWPDDPPASALQNTRRAIHWLRTALGDPSRIVHGQAGYTIRLGPGELDVHEFARLLGQARQRQRDDQPDVAADLLDRALGLWRGTPYAGAEDCPLLQPDIQRLTTLRLQALEARAVVYLALGRHADLVPELAGLVERDPRQERLVGLYMRALYAAGRQAEAQTAFWRTKDRLAEELGTDPTRELQELYEAIVCGTLEPPATVLARPPDAMAPRQLPADVYGFTGRDLELERLDSLLAGDDGPTAVVISAVSGTAGVGKTALAIHWAHRIGARFPDGQLYVNLRGFDPSGTVMEPAEAIRGFLDAFGVPPQRIPAELDAQAALYRSLLSAKRVLVVLDNARDTDQIRPLLPGSPGCLVVATSRSCLAGLTTKEGARPLNLDVLSAAEAHRLLEQRVGVERVRAEPEAVNDLITACARLPLALAIVAARAAMHPRFPLRELADELRRTRLDALAGDQSTDLRTVFSWSYRQLTPEAQRLFRLLGLHPGPDISAPAAASLAGVPPADVRPLLAELAGSHVITEHRPGRYTFHDLLRAYAAELAHTYDTEDARHEATHRMLDHYLHTTHSAACLLAPERDPVAVDVPAPGVTPEQLRGRDQAMAWFIAEHPVLLTAVRTAADSGHDAHTWQLAWGMASFLMWQGHWRIQLAVYQAALTATERLGDHSAQARIHRYLATAFTWLSQLSEARWHLQQSLDLSSRLGDRRQQANTYKELARLFEREENYAKALEYAQRAHDLFRESNNEAGIAYELNAIGWYYAQLGDHERALTSCEQALARYQQIRSDNGQADAWDSLGYVHHQLGHHEIALDCYQQALGLWRRAGVRSTEADTIAHIGDTQYAVGDLDSARRSWQQALDILEAVDHPDTENIRAKLKDLDGR